MATMSKTTPVRWWRDDADRYRSRGAYTAPPSGDPQWMIEMLSGSEPVLTGQIIEWRNRIYADWAMEPVGREFYERSKARLADWAWRDGSPVTDVLFSQVLARREVVWLNSDTNQIVEIRVGESEFLRVMIGRHRDGSFTVLESTEKPQRRRDRLSESHIQHQHQHSMLQESSGNITGHVTMGSSALPIPQTLADPADLSTPGRLGSLPSTLPKSKASLT